ncbi:hypothetical protein H4J58_03880 [Colwellia sp. MB3u-70]|uniref:hypothetical protein n=1 Tax=unclassified Colwellia TaxID=196834 RepID=UPI0015F60D33|nr:MULTISPECIES: hypothetical protein [unclassified Colwellia]MBA6293771.1 hypothetical protein [Colwellia sp. MB3u-8]MBA6306257.1 hypothetical protein [Colwellia sp. MB3u-70]
MQQELLFSSKEFKQLLGVSDCELMHLRVSGKLIFVKKGHTFLYQLEDKNVLLKHPLANQLVNWYREKHNISIDNYPKEVESINSTLDLIETVLLPVSKNFGDVKITYGFVSPELNRFIQKNSSSGTYPSIDQHAASELNNANNHICKRHGLACDFIINGYEKQMDQVMLFIVNNLSFDKIYYYGNDKPLHVSVGNESERHLQIMNISDKGRRIPGRKAYGNEAKILAEELIQ